jgi:serine/threonine protein kinase
VWDDYESVKELGEGGFGRVVIAKRKTDGSEFAVKIQGLQFKSASNSKLKEKLALFETEIELLGLLSRLTLLTLVVFVTPLTTKPTSPDNPNNTA